MPKPASPARASPLILRRTRRQRHPGGGGARLNASGRRRRVSGCCVVAAVLKGSWRHLGWCGGGVWWGGGAAADDKPPKKPSLLTQSRCFTPARAPAHNLLRVVVVTVKASVDVAGNSCRRADGVVAQGRLGVECSRPPSAVQATGGAPATGQGSWRAAVHRRRCVWPCGGCKQPGGGGGVRHGEGTSFGLLFAVLFSVQKRARVTGMTSVTTMFTSCVPCVAPPACDTPRQSLSSPAVRSRLHSHPRLSRHCGHFVVHVLVRILLHQLAGAADVQEQRVRP
jgi:hypothetical protein